MSKGDIFLATGLLEEGSLFKNGLHQNSLLFYSMFESMGYQCHCLVDCSGPFVPGYRFLEPEAYLMNDASYTLVAYIELGLSLDSAWRRLLQGRGCKTAKLYLGNILNIDTETVCLTPEITFHHHNAGGLHEVWTSPHYRQNLSYACALNGVPLSQGRLVPYIWDPTWIRSYTRWTPGPSWTHTDIVIMEPNISFQKCSLYPLLLVKAFANAYPDWKGRLIVQNADRLFQSIWFRERTVPQMNVPVVWNGRQPLQEILEANPSAIFLTHQITNDYNYLVLELMYLGYPLLHNSKAWSAFGFTWSEERWSESLQTLRSVLDHRDQRSAYEAHAQMLTWLHSPANPVNREGWETLLTKNRQVERDSSPQIELNMCQ
jgi:hypothetical protein